MHIISDGETPLIDFTKEEKYSDRAKILHVISVNETNKTNTKKSRNKLKKNHHENNLLNNTKHSPGRAGIIKTNCLINGTITFFLRRLVPNQSKKWALGLF